MKNEFQEEILEKEKRQYFQNILLEKYNKTLLAARVNYPGNDKNNNITEGIIDVIDNLLISMLNSYIYFKIYRITGEGPVITMLLDFHPIKLKRITAEIEDKHILGKCVSIDIYNSEGKLITRSESGCIEKPEDIFEGINSRQVRDKIGNIYKNYLNTFQNKILH